MSGVENIPKIPKWFFRWYCKRELYEEMHGDLEEFYIDRLKVQGKFRADLWYCYNVLRCCQPYAWKNLESQSNSNIGMVRNFYLSAVRNLVKNKSYSLISILGLTIGISSFIFISLYIVNELSYDRFHTHHENIYRVSNKAIIRGEPNEQATTGAPMGKVMEESYPEVKKATRLMKSGPLLIGQGDYKFSEENILFADQAFLDVFDFRLLKGNPLNALKQPKSVVLTEAYAQKYFGERNPVGQFITVEEDTTHYLVTGVVESAPANSHIQYDMLVSLSTKDFANTDRWIGRSLHTYVVLEDGSSPDMLSQKMHEIFYKYMAPEISYYTGMPISEWEASGNSVSFKLTAIKDIHLHSEAQGELEPLGNLNHIYVFGLIGLIVLFMAIFNFINLAIAHSANRAREVGVRKVIGSTKNALIYQFLLESTMVVLLGTILAAFVVITFTPFFTQLVGKELAFGIDSSYLVWPVLAGMTIFIGLLSGLYPSLVMASYKPIQVLKSGLFKGHKSGWLRNTLVALQFIASIVIIISTLTVYRQIDFMLSKNLGYSKDQVLVIKRAGWLADNLEPFKNDLLSLSNVSAVSSSKTIPGKRYDLRSYRRPDNPETYLFLNNQVNYDYLEMMGLELVAGRFFSRSYGADSNAVVLNESAVRAFDFDDPIGEPLSSSFKKGRPLKVIGVVKDYNVESLHKSVSPISIELDLESNDFLSIRINSDPNIPVTLGQIQDAWLKHSNEKPFQYFFLDQEYERLYQSEVTTGRILLVFSTLSIFVASIGLIGLIAFTTLIRRKEIGIRKILGAKLMLLIQMLTKDTVILLSIATLIAWPIAYLATEYWLQDFANRVAISFWFYIISVLIVGAIVGLVISFHTVKASMRNPVESLRQE